MQRNGIIVTRLLGDQILKMDQEDFDKNEDVAYKEDVTFDSALLMSEFIKSEVEDEFDQEQLFMIGLRNNLTLSVWMTQEQKEYGLAAYLLFLQEKIESMISAMEL